MNEEEWLKANDFSTLHHILWNIARDRARKYRLIGCNFCRLICPHITDERFHTVVDLAERYADDPQLQQQLITTFEKVEGGGVLGHGTGSELNVTLESCAPYYASDEFSSNELDRAVADADDMLMERLRPTESQPIDWDATTDAIRNETDEIVVRLIREVFGNPFRPVAFNAAWRTSDVMLLANSIYAEQAFDRMPILADALQDAGCDCDAMLNHIRDTSATHVRGCWALDLVLGKE